MTGHIKWSTVKELLDTGIKLSEIKSVSNGFESDSTLIQETSGKVHKVFQPMRQVLKELHPKEDNNEHS